MTKAIPQINRYMTTTPWTINSELDLMHAKNFMKEHSIRHLPVMDRGHVVGILSESDVDFLQGFKDVDLKHEKVENAMTADPYTVNADANLDEVCKKMATSKIGSVLVQDNNKLVGIFTWVDALLAMDNLLHTRLP
jgi:acetoin utilization protein AcuB